MRKVKRLASVRLNDWPARLHTVGKMRRDGVPVKATCARCDYWHVVDLGKVEANRGDDYCLINRRFKCPSCGTARTGFYLYRRGAGLPYRPLKAQDR